MDEINLKIAQLIEEFSDKLPPEVIVYNAWRYLREKWPQLNHKTEIRFVDRPEVQWYSPVEVPVAPFTWKIVYLPIQGWQIFKRFLFPDRETIDRLDNPDYRWQWVKGLWGSAFRAPTYAFWRIMGRLFMKQHWERRGQNESKEPDFQPMATAAFSPRPITIRLESFGWNWQEWGMEHGGRLVCSYNGERDVFLVLKRH